MSTNLFSYEGTSGAIGNYGQTKNCQICFYLVAIQVRTTPPVANHILELG